MLHLHSLLRYAVLVLLILVVVKAIAGLTGKKPYSEGDGKLALMLMIFTHLQLVIGLILYFTNGWATMDMSAAMPVAELRFWKVEHIAGMLLAVVLITVGRMRLKRVEGDARRHRIALIFFGISLILVMYMIPWEAARLY